MQGKVCRSILDTMSSKGETLTLTSDTKYHK